MSARKAQAPRSGTRPTTPPPTKASVAPCVMPLGDGITVEVSRPDFLDLFDGGNWSAGRPGDALALNALGHAAREFRMMAYALGALESDEPPPTKVLIDHCIALAHQLDAAIAVAEGARLDSE